MFYDTILISLRFLSTFELTNVVGFKSFHVVFKTNLPHISPIDFMAERKIYWESCNRLVLSSY